MIRMCDTMQTWKWGGFGLGWRRWGEREDSRQTGSALRCRGCAALEAALCRGHRRLAPSPLGSHSRGCDGGTAVGASPGVGTVVLPSPRGEGVGWRCGQVGFLHGAGRRGAVAG